VTGLTRASFDLDSGFDITTEAGRKAEAALEDLSGNLDDLIEGYQNGTIAAPDFASGQAAVEQSVREVAAQMGLTEAQTQVLIDTYASVPDNLTTVVEIDDQASGPVRTVKENLEGLPDRNVRVDVNDQATNPLRSIKDRLNEITSKTVTVTTVQRSTVNPDRRASGGPVRAGRQYLVGEEGPELVIFPDNGYVLDASATARIQSAADTDPARVLTPVSAGPTTVAGARTYNVMVPEGRDAWQEVALLDQLVG